MLDADGGVLVLDDGAVARRRRRAGRSGAQRMTSPNDPPHLFWLASRAFGVVAILLVRLRRPRAGLAGRSGGPALAGSTQAAARGARLCLSARDRRARPAPARRSLPAPGLEGLASPSRSRQPAWTGFGIIAGWLAAIVGLASTFAAGSASRSGAGFTAGRSPSTPSASRMRSAPAPTLAASGCWACSRLPRCRSCSWGTYRFLPRPVVQRAPAAASGAATRRLRSFPQPARGICRM